MLRLERRFELVDERLQFAVRGRRLEILDRRLRERAFHEAMLWVLEQNPRARRFYEASAWRADGAVKEDTFLDTDVREIRYRIARLAIAAPGDDEPNDS